MQHKSVNATVPTVSTVLRETNALHLHRKGSNIVHEPLPKTSDAESDVFDMLKQD